MTNTNRPANTLTGIVCAACSTWESGTRIQRRHASIAAVALCQSLPATPVVEVPTPAQVAEIFSAPEATPMRRWSASCPKTGCTTHAVKDHPFTLKCSDHGKTVRVGAKQLFGKVSTATHHRCDPRCTGAKGNICVCACGGVNHGLDLLVSFA